MGMGYDERTGPMLARIRELEGLLRAIAEDAETLLEAKETALSGLVEECDAYE